MKEIKLYIGIIAVLLTTMLTACSDSMVDPEPSTTSETEEGYYKASFRIAIPSFEENTTRSTVFLNEGIRNKDAMKLFCFDNKGQFVGFGKIQDDFTAVLGFKRENNGNYYEVDKNGNPTGSITHNPAEGVSGGGIKTNGSTEPKDFSALLSHFFTYERNYSTYLGYIPIALVAIFVLFIQPNNKFIKIGFIILTLCFCIPYMGHVFNGFGYVNTIITKLLGVQGIMLSDVGIVFNEILVDSPIYLFTFIFLSPLLEEYAFRGVLLNSLSKYGRYFALMMTTIVYTLAHASISEMIPSFVMGYLLAKMTLTYKSIRPSLFTHIMGNALLCAFTLVPEKYSIFSLVFIAILLISAIILVFSKKYNIISIGSSDSSKRAIKFFLSNIFVIIALLLFVLHL